MNIGRRLALLLLSLYQKVISPYLPPRCRFYPSCSHYATQAIRKHGVTKGGFYSLKRLSRCHPWHPGGIDRIP